jgi:2-iminobutanoate/2-iminopropanoate deaminase
MSTKKPPLSPSRRVGQLVFLSGQVAKDLSNGTVVAGGVKEQTRQVLENLRANLRAEGLDLSHIVKVNVYLAHPSDFAAFNEAYLEFFGDPLPVRTTVAVQLVSSQYLIEIDAIAADD